SPATPRYTPSLHDALPISTERSGITTASEFGIGTLPSDHYLNATVFSGMAHHIQVPPVPKMPDLEKKAYIALFISDGDNIQYSRSEEHTSELQSRENLVCR